LEGIIKSINQNKLGEYTFGYTLDREYKDHFFHCSSLIDCSIEELNAGDAVEFRIGLGNTGKEQALDVRRKDGDTAEAPSAAPRPRAVLIVSLSIFRRDGKLDPSRYFYLQDGQETESGEYYQQQEPFPMRLRHELGEDGVIILLTTEAARAETEVLFRGSQIRRSPETFFMERVRAVPGLENVSFRSVWVDQDDPEPAIREVAEFLRSLKTPEAVPEVYLAPTAVSGARS
jgi:cold shock CspA family protein